MPQGVGVQVPPRALANISFRGRFNGTRAMSVTSETGNENPPIAVSWRHRGGYETYFAPPMMLYEKPIPLQWFAMR